MIRLVDRRGPGSCLACSGRCRISRCGITILWRRQLYNPSFTLQLHPSLLVLQSMHPPVATRQATPSPVATRQATPSDTVGILSNSNVRLEERLDLVDFLDEQQDASKPGQWDHISQAPRAPPASALQIALNVEAAQALAVLQDELPSMLPWHLQALWCTCFPLAGIEATVRCTQEWLPIESRARQRAAECLDVLSRWHASQHIKQR